MVRFPLSRGQGRISLRHARLWRPQELELGVRFGHALLQEEALVCGQLQWRRQQRAGLRGGRISLPAYPLRDVAVARGVQLGRTRDQALSGRSDDLMTTKTESRWVWEEG